MLHVNRTDRAEACMLGMAVGDALGAPLEGLVSQQIRNFYGVVTDYVDGSVAWRRKPYRWRLPGLYSDDTQQALALCDTLLAYGEVDPNHLVRLYLDLATPRGVHLGAHRGVGRSFRQAVGEWERGVPPSETGSASAGIGAAMRIAPIALYYDGEADAIFDAVMNASLMTHRDIRSLAGAMAVVHAVRHLAAGSPKEPSLLFRVAADVSKAEERIAAEYADRVVGVKEHQRSVSTAIARAESLLESSRDRALASLVEEANRHGADPVCKRATMGFPPALIPACLYLLLTTDTFEDSIVEVVNLGGDADTAGAILGAMAGAHYGRNAIPERWLDGLHNQEGIAARAQALVLRSSEDLAIPDLVTTEWALSRLEDGNREGHPTSGREGATRPRPQGTGTDAIPPVDGAF
jgi:ADP-ribosyl-[dinitrogen reductase] hydrolase